MDFMTCDNFVFGATSEEFERGTHAVNIRRQNGEEYIQTFITIIREATEEETRNYHIEKGLTFKAKDGDRYYAFFMD